MSIGVGLALLANSYMPDTEKRLREDQEVIETMFRKILREMALHLNNAAGERNLVMRCADLKPLFAQARRGPKSCRESIAVYQYVLFRVLCDEKNAK